MEVLAFISNFSNWLDLDIFIQQLFQNEIGF